MGAHKIGEVVKGKVLRLANFGAFVELAPGIEGLCHISEIEERRSKKDRQQPKKEKDPGAPAVLAVGTEYDFKVVKMDPEQRRIGLSYRGALQQEERRTLQEYRSSKSSSTATIGDILLSKREMFS